MEILALIFVLETADALIEEFVVTKKEPMKITAERKKKYVQADSEIYYTNTLH